MLTGPGRSFCPGRNLAGADPADSLAKNGEFDAGKPLAWYDPAQPVTIQFTHIGGETPLVSGGLPLHHSVGVNDSEYRFNIVRVERSFVEVTGDRCAFP